MSNKKHEFVLNPGTSSILFIFVILCLVSFAVLSVSSAVGDYSLSNRVQSNSKGYYEACNEAQSILADTDSTLKELYSSGISRTGYYEKVGKKKSFSLYVSDVQTLNVEIQINYPSSSGEAFYDIISWQLETSADLDYNESLPVFQ